MGVEEKVNLLIRQGASWSQTFDLADLLPEVDLDGAVLLLQVRYFPWEEDVLLELSSEEGGLVLADGVMTAQLTPEETAALSFRNARYDVRLTTAAGDVHYLAVGQADIMASVSRPEAL